MTIELTGATEELVLRLAKERGRTPDQVVADSLQQLAWEQEPNAGLFAIDEEERNILAERMAEADRGEAEILTHEEVGRRLGLV